MMNQELELKRQKIEKILENALPSTYNNEWIEDTFGKVPDCVTKQHFSVLSEPCRTLLDLGGKRWRPLLLVLCAELAAKSNINDEKEKSIAAENAYKLTPLLEFVHTASLIHDDIEDKADTRRGKSAAHITYGIDTALNAGSWLYFEAATVINQINADEKKRKLFYDLYAKELRRLHLGQAMDILWHRTPSLFPSIEEYGAMVRFKTGTLSSLAAKVGTLSGGASLENADLAGQTAADIGAGFQILDDVQNLTTGNPGKKRGDDIVEGKKSLPVLLHIQSYPDDKLKISELFQKAAAEGIDSCAVEQCISLLEKGGCISKAFEQGKELVAQKSIELTRIIGDCDCDTAKSITGLFNNMLPVLK